jgi:hypothetical protein
MLLLPCVLGLSVFFYGLWAVKHDTPTSVSLLYNMTWINNEFLSLAMTFVIICHIQLCVHDRIVNCGH